MDHTTQLGWNTPQNEVSGATARLVRDVFVAGDMVHETALLEMGVDINGEVDSDGRTQESEGESSTAGEQNPPRSEEGHVEGSGQRSCVQGHPLRAWQ